jgi:TonB family protein
VKTPYSEQSAAVRKPSSGIGFLASGDDGLNLGLMMLISLAAHLFLVLFTWLLIQILLFFGFNIPLFDTLSVKPRDIEFVLVESPTAPPRDKNTKNRAEKASRSGGKKVAHKPVVETQTAAGNPSPKQRPQPAQKATPKPQPQPRQQQVARTAPRPTQPSPKPQQQTPTPTPPTPTKVQKPSPPSPRIPKPTKIADASPSLPKNPIAPTIPIPSPKNPGGAPAGPVAKTPGSSTGGGSTSGGSSGGPTSQQIAGAPSRTGGSGAPRSGRTGGGGGSAGSGSFNQSGSPGGGGGRAGIDALPEPDFGPYIAELQRRIRRNWSPPTADRSKRVVAFFKISRDGRLLSLTLSTASGTKIYDDAALAAVRASAPFRPLPAEFRGQDIDVQFTFDYDVYQGGGGARMR